MTPSDAQAHALAHVRRLEALGRPGIVERLAEGSWRVPTDLADQGKVYDRRRGGDVTVEVLSQTRKLETRVVGATWLDRELARDGASQFTAHGFGAEAREALKDRAEFLTEQGLAQRRGRMLVLARDFLATLRERELALVAKTLAKETGLTFQPTVDGERVSGIYRRSVLLASGRFAMLDDGLGFRLVPWARVIEKHLGQSITATMRSGGIDWQIGRQLSR